MAEDSDANNIADTLERKGWSPLELATLPAFGALWGDYGILKSVFIEGIAELPEAERHSLYRAARLALIDRDLSEILSLRLHEADQRRKSAMHIMYQPVTASWLQIVGNKPGSVTCTLLTSNSDETKHVAAGGTEQEHPFKDFAKVYLLADNAQGKIMSLVINPTGLTYLTGDQPNLVEVIEINRQDTD